MPLIVPTRHMSIAVPAICLLLLAGCDKAAQQPAGKSASAEVLPGSISDAMINLDQSRAQPLLQPPPRVVTGASEAPLDTPSDIPPDPVKPEAVPAN